LNSAPPPSEPDRRFSRIRLSSWWFTSMRIDGRRRSMHRDQTSLSEHAAKCRRVACIQTRQHEKPTITSVLRRALAEKSMTGLASRHSRQMVPSSLSCYSSTSLRPFAPSPLRDFLATMHALTPARSALRFLTREHELRLCFGQVSLLYAPELPVPPSPTTHQALDVAFARYPSARRVSPILGSRLHHDPAGSPALAGRIEFVSLRMDRSPPAAPHPASRRRSCSRLQAGERIPGGDFHPSIQCALTGALGPGFSP